MAKGLTQDQLDRFAADGCLVIENVIEERSLAALRDEYEARLDAAAAALKSEGAIGETYDGAPFAERYTRLLADCPRVFDFLDICYALDGDLRNVPVMHAGPAVFDILTDPGVLDIVESVMGPEILSNPVQHARIKPPLSALSQQTADLSYIGRTGWHQDMGALFDEAADSQILTVWIAVTDATEENGCLVAIPGSHRTDGGRLKTHCPGAGAFNAENFIPGRGLSGGERRTLPVRRGGVVLFNRFTEHAALPNRSDGLRFSLDLRYNPVGQPTGRPAFPGFVARSRAHPESVLSDWRAWKALWKQAAADILSGAYQGPVYEAERWKAHSGSPICA